MPALTLEDAFNQRDAFIGKDLAFIAKHISMRPTFDAMMDFGMSVTQWRSKRLLLEMWFQSGKCTHVELKRLG